MTVRDRAPIGQPCWVDLQSADPGVARTFYPAVVGCEAGEASEEYGGYFQFFTGGAPVAGGSPKMDPAMPDTWTVYVAVDDAAATVERASAAGALVYAPAMPVGDLGTMAVVADPAGAAIGVWQPIGFQGFGLVDEAGAPTWFELHSRDFAGSLAFHSEVFGWATRVVSDTDDLRYAVAVEDGPDFLGIRDASRSLAEGVPSHWSVYFGVADVDAAVAAALGLGGSVVTPPTDTPYGRLAQLRDPGGAGFRLMSR